MQPGPSSHVQHRTAAMSQGEFLDRGERRGRAEETADG